MSVHKWLICGTMLVLLASLAPSQAVRAAPQKMGDIDAPDPIPIVYVHGFNDSHCLWEAKTPDGKEANPTSIRFTLHTGKALDLDEIVNYGRTDCKSGTGEQHDPAEGDLTLPAIWGQVEAAVLRAHEKSPTGYVDIVAHSMGGLVSRWYLNNPRARGREYVRTLVMIATPNHGSFGPLGLRTLALWEDPDWFQFDNEAEARTAVWEQRYYEYVDMVGKRYGQTTACGNDVVISIGQCTYLRNQYPGFFEWLAEQRSTAPGKYKDLDVLLEQNALPPKSKRAWDHDSPLPRFTGQFEEFLYMIMGKGRARGKAWKGQADVAAPITRAEVVGALGEHGDDKTPEYDWARITASDLVQEHAVKADSRSIAIDRLLPEYVPVQLGVDASGKASMMSIPVNPALVDLNSRDRERPGITRYIGVAGTTEYWQAQSSTWAAAVVGTYAIKPNDKIVEWDSVALPLRATDRFFRFDAKGRSSDVTAHGELTYKNEDVKRTVKAELANYFGATQERTTYGTLRIGYPLPAIPPYHVQQGTSVFLGIENTPLPAQEPAEPQNFLLLAQATWPFYAVPRSGASASAWVFKEYADGSTELSPLQWETPRAHWRTVSLANVRRLALLTTMGSGDPSARDNRPPVEVSFRYDHPDILAASIEQAQDRYDLSIPQVDASHYPFMVAYVSVRDRWGRGTSLRSSDFWLEDTGTAILTADAEPATNRFVRKERAIMLDLDFSGSMAGAPVDMSKEAARILIDQLKPGTDAVGAIGFSTDSTMLSSLTNNFNDVKGKLSAGRAEGGTDIYGSLLTAMRELQNRRARKAVVLMTDGQHNTGSNTADQAVSFALEHGITIFAVGLGKEVNHKELDALATRTGGIYLFAPQPEHLAELYQVVSDQVSGEYKVTWVAPPSGDDSRSVTIGLVKGSNARATKPYNPGAN